MHSYSFIFKEKCKWLENVTSSHIIGPTQFKKIKGNIKKGYYIYFKDENIMMFKPINQNLVFVDTSRKIIFKRIFSYSNILKQKIQFVNHLWTPNEVECINIQSDHAYQWICIKFGSKFIPCFLHKIRKYQSEGFYKEAILFAQEVYEKAQNLNNKWYQRYIKTACLIAQSECYFMIKDHYSSLKKIIKATKKSVNYTFNSSKINKVTIDINKQLKQQYNLHFNFQTRQLIYFHPKFKFYCNSYNLLKLNDHNTIKSKLRSLRYKRCATCFVLNQKKKNKCSKCRKIYYCSKQCQKQDWIYHQHECF